MTNRRKYMKRFKLKIGLDVDDVLLQCIPYAIQLANEKYQFNPPIQVDEVKGWGLTGTRTDVIFEFFNDETFFKTQPIIEGSKEFVKKLSQMAELFIITAVDFPFMSVRVERILKEFPFIPETNIIVGKRKDVVMMDIVLDDGGHNILASKSTYPVLLRCPWNQYITGGLSVNNFNDFLHFVKEVQSSYTEKERLISKAPIVLVGPSGSGKNKIAKNLCANQDYEKIVSYTNNINGRNHHNKITTEDFKRKNSTGFFFETTSYGGFYYGCCFQDVSSVLAKDKTPVLVLDICGAIALRRIYPETLFFYTKKSTKELISNILNKNLTNEDKTERILSLNLEKKNEKLCDFTISSVDELLACI